MDNDMLPKNPYWQVTLLASRLRHDVAQFAENHGLSSSQMQALLLIEPKQQIPMNQLSCMISCDASYITGIVNKFTHLGYIRRQESSVDRRIKTIELTKEGVTFRSKLIRDFNTFYIERSQLKSIDESVIQGLNELLTLTAVKPQTKTTQKS